MKLNGITRIGNNWFRIGNQSIYVDFIYTSSGIIRIGSMPDISKYTRKHKINENFVILTDWNCSLGGDNRTGEEFNFWCYASSLKRPPLYVGKKNNITELYKNLDMIFSYYFDDSRTKIVRTEWLNKLFNQWVVEEKNIFRVGDTEVKFEDSEIIILDKGKKVFRGLPDFYKNYELIERELSSVKRIKNYSSLDNYIEVVVIGNGNGFIGTPSSFVVKFSDYMIWIDPCGQPALSLGRAGIHWNDITHILITHNHEDHISGFTACLKKARDNGEKIKLITAPSIYEVLIKQFSPLFPDIREYIELIKLSPDNPITFDNYKLKVRWNHHILPYGTLGLKICTKGSCWGLSGDTKYSMDIVRKLKKEELSPEWFAECNVVFHEVEFDNPNGVHTYYKDLLELQGKIKGRIFVYHADPYKIKGGFVFAEECKRYIIENGRLELVPSL